jgi:hypothetical protein
LNQDSIDSTPDSTEHESNFILPSDMKSEYVAESELTSDSLPDFIPDSIAPSQELVAPDSIAPAA